MLMQKLAILIVLRLIGRFRVLAGRVQKLLQIGIAHLFHFRFSILSLWEYYLILILIFDMLNIGVFIMNIVYTAWHQGSLRHFAPFFCLLKYLRWILKSFYRVLSEYFAWLLPSNLSVSSRWKAVCSISMISWNFSGHSCNSESGRRYSGVVGHIS